MDLCIVRDCWWGGPITQISNKGIAALVEAATLLKTQSGAVFLVKNGLLGEETRLNRLENEWEDPVSYTMHPPNPVNSAPEYTEQTTKPILDPKHHQNDGGVPAVFVFWANIEAFGVKADRK